MSLCDNCKINPANHHYHQIRENERIEVHLCNNCINKKTAPGVPFNYFDFELNTLMNSLSETKELVRKTKICPNCAFDFYNIVNSGCVGCAECYKTFITELTPTIARIHGNAKHIGKVPISGGDLHFPEGSVEQLKNQLKQAIVNEDFELAAKLRDKIRNSSEIVE